MPSTRSTLDMLTEGLPFDYSDDDMDPDYRESSDEDDELPRTMHRDRAKWIEDNVEDLEWLYRKLLEDGRSVMGNAFLQLGNINDFANYVYRQTTPFTSTTAVSSEP